MVITVFDTPVGKKGKGEEIGERVKEERKKERGTMQQSERDRELTFFLETSVSDTPVGRMAAY